MKETVRLSIPVCLAILFLGDFSLNAQTLSATQSQINLACNGVCNGSAAVVASGGTAPYTYSWSPSGGTGATASSLCAGNYTCTITDAAAASITKSFTITQPSALTVTPVSQTNIACNGGHSGAATVTVSGGTGAGTYTYDWAPGTPTGDGTNSVTGLAAGTYTVTVTDANSCTATRSFTIAQPSALTATPISQTNIACYGGSTGAATVTVTGGTGAGTYTYDWTPGTPTGDGTNSVTGLAAGTYTVTVTDANSCTATRSFNIAQPAAPVSGTTVVTNVACFGGSNGAINLTPSGGTPGYTFDWGGGVTTEDRTGLAAGSRTVIITDANGCVGSVNTTVTQPSAAVSGTTVVTNVACFGGSNGAINLTPSGGTPGYTFDWGGGVTTEDRTGLAAGSRTVIITDANGCVGSVNTTVTQPSAAVSGTTVVTNVACFGGSNGAINLTPSGGTPGYTFDWGGGITTEDRTGLAAGSYTVTITDANGCTGTVNVTVSEPSAAVSGTTVVTNVSCFGGSNGTVDLTPSGGTPAYTFNWGGGITTEDRTGLAAGSYTATITDANGCTGTVNVTVTEPSAITTATGSQTNVACNGGADGIASITASGGTPGYFYSWSPSGGTAATATGLTAGTYTVTVTDTNTCTATRTYTITEPSAITTITSQTNVSCNGSSNSSATVTPSGGTGSYTYSWIPSGGTAATASGLAAGSYTCTITDANACSITENFTITEPSALTATTSQTDITCTGASTGTATVVAGGGTGSKIYAWSPAGGTSATATGLPAGTYTCTITDANSCSITKTFSITEPAAIPGSNTYSLPTSNQTVTGTVNDTNFVTGTCDVVNTVMASGVNPVSGTVASKVWIEGSVPDVNGIPFVQRHYEVTPATNAATATGTVTLYFTQTEFDNFNAHAASALDLPASSADSAGKANLRIGKYSGVSGDGTGLPSSYSDSILVIDPDDSNIVWNAASSSWEITFAVDGFSGFIVQTSVSVLPVNWISFTAKEQGQSAVLNWSTTGELDTRDFIVQRSIDGITWRNLAVIAAGANNGSLHNYTYLDNMAGKDYNYYRIMQTDAGGHTSYSEVRVLKLPGMYAPFTLSGNLIGDGVLRLHVHQASRFSLYDLTGKLLWVKRLVPGLQSVNVSGYAKGVYLLKTVGETQKIAIQ